jgi:hypothetical protein
MREKVAGEILELFRRRAFLTGEKAIPTLEEIFEKADKIIAIIKDEETDLR